MFGDRRNKNGDEDYDFVGNEFSIEDHIIPNNEFLEIKSAIIASVKSDPGIQMMCHDPGYGLAFIKNRQIVFKTTVCFKCINLGVNAMGLKFYPPLERSDVIEKSIFRCDKFIRRKQ